MKKFVLCALFVFVAVQCFAIDVYFSPDGGCQKAIISEIGKAKDSVLVQAYSFTSEPIAQALVAAKKRGVDVRVILDKGQVNAKSSQIPALLNAEIPTSIDDKHAIAHNKVIIVDVEAVVTGSYNFSKAAANQAENVVVIPDRDIAVKYADNWKAHQKHSTDARTYKAKIRRVKIKK